MTDFTVVRNSFPPKHVCNRPGWWQRRKLGIRAGGRIRCDDCGQLWEWRDEGWYDPWYEWVRIDEEGNRVWPENSVRSQPAKGIIHGRGKAPKNPPPPKGNLVPRSDGRDMTTEKERD